MITAYYNGPFFLDASEVLFFKAHLNFDRYPRSCTFFFTEMAYLTHAVMMAAVAKISEQERTNETLNSTRKVPRFCKGLRHRHVCPDICDNLNGYSMSEF